MNGTACINETAFVNIMGCTNETAFVNIISEKVIEML